jgi:hypothetical protein
VPKQNEVYRRKVYFKHEDYGVLTRLKDALEEAVRQNLCVGCAVQFDFE